MWRSAVEEHGVKVCQPNQGGMGIKLIVTLVCNLFAALVLARVIHQVGHHMDLLRGLKIGAGVGLGFCATALTMTYVWQSHREDSGPSMPVTISSGARSWVQSWRSGGSRRSSASHEVHKRHKEILYASVLYGRPVRTSHCSRRRSYRQAGITDAPATVHPQQILLWVVFIIYEARWCSLH
jgi:hypothetical protein